MEQSEPRRGPGYDSFLGRKSWRRTSVFAFRMLRRNPRFTLVSILTLALGIGATTMVFNITDALLLNAFPYRAAGRLAFFYIHEIR